MNAPHRLWPILLVLFFFSPWHLSTAASATSCNQTDRIDYKGGPYSVLFKPENRQYDCSFSNSAQDENTILHGRLTSQLINLDAVLHGDPDKLKPNGDGTLNITLGDLSTFGVGGDIMNSIGADGVPNKNKLIKYQKNIEAYQNYDFNEIITMAAADGILSYEAFVSWACQHDLCICNGPNCHVNPSVFSFASQTTTLKEQLQETLSIATEIINCNNESYAASHPCSTFYALPGGNSLTAAQMVKNKLDPQHLTESWNKLSEREKFLAFSLHVNQSAPTFILLVPQKKDCHTIFCLLKEVLGFNYNPQKPGYIKAIIPQVQNLKNGLLQANNRFTPLKEQSQANKSPVTQIAAINQANDISPTIPPTAPSDSLLTLLLTQAQARDPNCGSAPIPLQENLGANATPVKNTSLFSIPYNFLAPDNNPNKTQENLYCVYVFSPPELTEAEKLMGEDDNSILRKLLPGKTTGYETKIDAPWQFGSHGDAQTENNPSCLQWAKNLETGADECIEVQDNYVSYQKSAIPANQPAGKLPLNEKLITFGIARPLKDIIPPDQCLVPWLNNQAVAEGFQLSKTLNADQYNNTTCPNPIQFNQNLPSSPGDCRQALFEKGACPGGMDCIDYICANSGGLNCSLLIMIAANESGGLFSCMSDLSSIKHFGCDPWGRAGYSNTIESKLQCAVNTLKGYTDLTAALQNYGYSSVNDLPWAMFGLTPATSLTSDNNNIAALKAEIYGGDTTRWWRAYCNRFPNLVRESGQQADPASYSCDRY